MSLKQQHQPLVPIQMQQFARCGAKSKRTGQSCQQPAMVNGRCRLHGGKSTGPKTEAGKARSQRANWKHGGYSAEAKMLRLMGLMAIREANNLMQQVMER